MARKAQADWSENCGIEGVLCIALDRLRWTSVSNAPKSIHGSAQVSSRLFQLGTRTLQGKAAAAAAAWTPAVSRMLVDFIP